jgi:hypothetical protein
MKVASYSAGQQIRAFMDFDSALPYALESTMYQASLIHSFP